MITYIKHRIAYNFFLFLCLATDSKASLSDLPDELLLRVSYHSGVAKALRPVNYKLASLFSSEDSTLTISLSTLNSSTFRNYYSGKKKDEKDFKSPLENPSPFFPVKVSFSGRVTTKELSLLPKVQPALRKLEFDASELSQNLLGDEFAPLSLLTDLKDLRAYGCRGLKNITYLAPLTQLIKLELVGKYVPLSNITPLSNQSNLTYLRLSLNNIKDYSPLSSSIKLKYLELMPDSINNLDFLSTLTQLQSLYIRSAYKGINDINGLTALFNLKQLTITGSKIKDPQPIGKLTNLQYLDLSVNPLETLEPLTSLYNLKRLELRKLGYSKPRSFDPLRKLIALEYLDLDHTSISTFSFLRDMKSLKQVNFGEYDIDDSQHELSNIEKEFPNLKVKVIKNLDDEMD